MFGIANPSLSQSEGSVALGDSMEGAGKLLSAYDEGDVGEYVFQECNTFKNIFGGQIRYWHRNIKAQSGSLP